MANKRVRHGQVYVFDPCGWDIMFPQHCMGAKKGDLVRVVQLPMAPPPGTMGQAHIETLAGDLIGMCSVHSLTERRRDLETRKAG